MNDTESRLRDYLDTKAATIPDDHEPQGLELVSHHRRSWPIVIAAAAIAAILVVAVPVAIHLSGKDKTPPPPADKPSTELRIPYVLSDGTTKTLHDGKQTVKIDDSLVIGPSGRVAGGWLFIKGEAGGPFQTGTLQADGKFQPLGPQNTRGILKSPDGSKVAVTLAAGKGKTKVLVLDVATRKEIASVTLPHQTTVLWAWNQAGLWFGEDYKVGAQPLLWQPGQGQPVQLTIPGFDLGLEGATDSDKVQVVTRTNKGESWCMKLGSAQGTGFAVDRQYCGSGGRAFYPVVSPDGRTMVHPGSSLSADSRTEVQPQPVVIDVATGKATKLRLPRPISDLPAPVFEDDTHLLFTGTGLRDKQPPKTPPSIGPDGSPVTAGISVIRCDVTSGDCKLVFTTPTGVRIKLGRP